MFCVERAVIMAAGRGERMMPVTESVPKPLIRVNGKVLIEKLIDNLRFNGIDEIHIVTGYKSERFEYLKEGYGVDLIYNPLWNCGNNILSLFQARDHLENAMILDGDQIINNPRILCPYFERSGYNAVFTESYTNEWLLTVENGIIKSCSRTGGINGWQLFSISRWDQQTAKKLKKHLEFEVLNNHNTQLYWDDIAIFSHPDDFELGIYRMDPGDCVEIDTFKELCAVDNSYLNYGN